MSFKNSPHTHSTALRIAENNSARADGSAVPRENNLAGTVLKLNSSPLYLLLSRP